MCISLYPLVQFLSLLDSVLLRCKVTGKQCFCIYNPENPLSSHHPVRRKLSLLRHLPQALANTAVFWVTHTAATRFCKSLVYITLYVFLGFFFPTRLNIHIQKSIYIGFYCQKLLRLCLFFSILRIDFLLPFKQLRVFRLQAFNGW